MKLKSFRSLVIAAAAVFALSISTARAEEPTPPPASSHQPAPKPSTEVAPKPAARREDAEPGTLLEAKAELKKARGERDSAEADLLNEQNAHTKTKGILASTLETCKTAQAARDKFEGEAKANKEGWDKEVAAHGKSKELLDLAEGALLVKGVDSSAVVPNTPAPAAKQSAADFDRRLAATNDPKERATITAEFEKAFAEGRIG